THTIAVEATGTKSSKSQGAWIWVDAFDYVGAALTSAATAPDPATAVALAGGTTVISSDPSSLSVGSASVGGSGGVTPSGLALVSYRQNGVMVSEAGVPASVPVLEGRINAEIGGPVNTGFALANSNESPATISYFFTDANGNDSGSGSFTLQAHGQIAKFLN